MRRGRYAQCMHDPITARPLRGPSKTLDQLSDSQLQQFSDVLVAIWRQQKCWIDLPTPANVDRMAQLFSMLVMLRMKCEVPAVGSSPSLLLAEVRRRTGR